VNFEGVAEVEDFASVLQSTENLLEVELNWSFQPSIVEVLPIFKSWRHLRRLKLIVDREGNEYKPTTLNVIYDCILHMKNLTYLRIWDPSHCQTTKVLEKQINELVKPRRPGFHFKGGCECHECCYLNE
jgi:hypothetical protein